MEKMQAFIDFIFYEVWCKAPTGAKYSLDLFVENPELHEVMTAFHYDDSKRAEFFAGNVERIYGLFSALTTTQIQDFQRWYAGNNDLVSVCANDSNAHLVRYTDLASTHKELGEHLADFFKNLYSNSAQGAAVLRAKIGDIDDHYNAFVSINKVGKCPFCGLASIKSPRLSTRSPYDHYLPKALYPFNSINFRNLAPACHDCNSSYKCTKDPAHSSTGRRKAFNPYSKAEHTVQVKITMNHAELDRLGHSDIVMEFGPPELIEELETWKDLYGIEERYKDKLCEENDGYFWLMQVVDEWQANDEERDNNLKKLFKDAHNNPYAECNFLKKPFLEACQQIGLI